MLLSSDDPWPRIREHLPGENTPEGRPGRKPVPVRQALEAVLWILNTEAQRHMLPKSHPNCKTVHRRVQPWCEREILRAILADLANELRDRGDILVGGPLEYAALATDCQALTLPVAPFYALALDWRPNAVRG